MSIQVDQPQGAFPDPARTKAGRPALLADAGQVPRDGHGDARLSGRAPERAG